MVKGFSKRKLKLHESLGEKLKNARQSLGVDLLEAETATKIRAKYLSALEADDWSSLPGSVYTRGFLLAYVKYLDLDKSEILKLFETELNYFRSQKSGHILSYQNSLKDVKVLVTPKLIGYSLLSLFVCAMFGYIILQVQNFAGSPNLKVTSPSNNTVSEIDTVDIAGATDNDTYLTVNGENVPVTNDGHFETNLKLRRGVNIVKVQAENKTKKSSSEILTIEYKPKTAMTDSVVNQ